MTTAGPSIQRHSPHPVGPSYHQYRHHPYAHSTPSSNNGSGNSNTKRVNGHSRSSPNDVSNGDLPPSPPRSRRDNSETPSIGLGVAFGGSGGGKWWDEELPPPPTSLSSILDSFRKSGEGDRDLLLSILGAKKAEEERLTALIQTRLTILQARLSLHSAAAAMNAAVPMGQAPSSDGLSVSMSMTASPNVHSTSHLSPGSPNPNSASHHAHPHTNGSSSSSSMPPPPPFERTPSLTSSRGPGSTSDGIASPPLPAHASYSHLSGGKGDYEKELSGARERNEGRGYWQLPSLQSSLRPPQPQGQGQNGIRSPISPSHPHDGLPLAPIRDIRVDDKDRRSYASSNGRARSNGSLSPKSHVSDHSQNSVQGRNRSGSGLEMLLDAGRVVNESAKRDV